MHDNIATDVIMKALIPKTYHATRKAGIKAIITSYITVSTVSEVLMCGLGPTLKLLLNFFLPFDFNYDFCIFAFIFVLPRTIDSVKGRFDGQMY
jgi:hypothetical protein